MLAVPKVNDTAIGVTKSFKAAVGVADAFVFIQSVFTFKPAQASPLAFNNAVIFMAASTKAKDWYTKLPKARKGTSSLTLLVIAKAVPEGGVNCINSYPPPGMAVHL